MRKAQMDTLMAAMLDSHDLVSDLNLSVDAAPLEKTAGDLVPVKVTPPIENLTPFQTEVFALNLMHNDRRLCQMLLQQGSCDSSYFLPGKARFRVNIFSQRGNYAVVMRKRENHFAGRAAAGVQRDQVYSHRRPGGPGRVRPS